MKSLKLYVSACLLACSTMASAQFVTGANTNNTTQQSSTTAVVTEKNDNSWGGLKFSYKPVTWDFDGEEEDGTAFSLEFIGGSQISKDAPVCFEWGIGYQYTGYDDDGLTLSLHSMNIPLVVGYDFDLSKNVSIMPYAGIDMKVNLGGSIEMDGYDEIDPFDDDDWEETWSRFLIGWKIGADVNLGDFFMGVSYGSDFNEIQENIKLSTTSISVGFKF